MRIRDELRLRAERQRQQVGHVTELQPRDDRDADHRAHLVDHRLHVVAVVVLERPRARELPEHERLLAREHPRQVQLVDHSFDPERLLVDVLDEQDAALDVGHVRRADERREDREVAAPQRARHVDALHLRRLGDDRRGRLRQRLPEVLHREVARRFRAEVGRQHRPAEGLDTRLRVQRELDRGEIAVTDERDRLVAQAAFEPAIIEPVQDARGAVAAAHRERDVRQRALGIRQAVQVARPLAVGAAESLKAALRRLEVLDAMLRAAQALERAIDRVGIVRITGRRQQADGVGRGGLKGHGERYRGRQTCLEGPNRLRFTEPWSPPRSGRRARRGLMARRIRRRGRAVLHAAHGGVPRRTTSARHRTRRRARRPSRRYGG